MFVLQFNSLRLIALAAVSASFAPAQPGPIPQATAQAPRHICSLPMYFEPNLGQTDPQVNFLSRGPGYQFFLTPTQAVLSLGNNPRRTGARFSKRSAGLDRPSPEIPRKDLRMTLLGSNPNPEAQGLDVLPGTVSYFLGNDPTQWHTAIPTYAKVSYHQVYPGVDLVYYGNHRQVEYDFVVGPHANPKNISIAFEGADKLELDAEGGLVAHLGNATVRWKKPYAYQQTPAGRREVPASFVLHKGNRAQFHLASYDRSCPLVIDPALVYATYLGGSGGDFLTDIALDSANNICVLCDTDSLNFPRLNPYQSANAGGSDVTVTKFNPSGSTLIFSTYLGGTSNDYSGALAVDSSGNLLLTGQTFSPNFPTVNAAYGANRGYYDAFVTKINPQGTSLLYSTYLGGGGDDSGNAIAVDSVGNAYVAGDTYSLGTGNSPFPTTHSAYQGNNNGGRDAFITKFTSSGTVVYSTFLGGHTDEKANAIAVDSGGNAIVVGQISATLQTYPAPPYSDFPTMNAFQPAFNLGSTNPDAGTLDGFVSKLDTNGANLVFSTYLGGDDDDFATGVTVDASGRVYIIGETSSTNFPVSFGAVQPFNGGIVDDPLFPGPDAFVTVLQPNGMSLYYSTYLGGSDPETGGEVYNFGIAVDKFGAIYVAGSTTSSTNSILDFPLTAGADELSSDANEDAFVSKINPAVPGPNGLVYSSLVSGNYQPEAGGYASTYNKATAITVDASGNFYVGGFTGAIDFPVTNAFRSTNTGGFSDAFVAKFVSPPDLSASMWSSADTVLVGSNMTYTIQINNNGRTSFTGVTNVVRLATNVYILPASITSTIGNWSINGTTVTFNVGTLTNNASVTQTLTFTNPVPIVMTNTATVRALETPTLEINQSNNVATVVSTIQGIADLRLTSASSSPATLFPGGLITNTFTVINKGPAWPATQVAVTDALPATLTYAYATVVPSNGIPVWGTDFDGNVFFNFGTLPVGSNYVVTMLLLAISNGTTANTIVASAFELDPNLANNSVTFTTTINSAADLGLSMSGPTGAIYAGTNVTYNITVTNIGPSDAANTVLMDTLPAAASFNSATTSQGTNTYSGGVLTCNLGYIPAGSNATVSVTVTPSYNGGVLVNTATVTNSSLIDANPANNRASVTNTVLATADVQLSPSGSTPSSILVNSNLTFSFYVYNAGPSTASGLVLNDRLPAGFTFVSSSGANCYLSNGVVTCPLGNLAAGFSTTVSLLTRAVLDGVYTNTGTATSSAADPYANNTASVTVSVNPNPKLPVLRISRSGTNAILSWSTNLSGNYYLQSLGRFSLSNNWSFVTNAKVLIGTNYFVTNRINGTNLFYRLVNTNSFGSLSYSLSGTNLVLSWPASAPDSTVLKTTTNLSGAILWANVTNPKTLVGGAYYLTNPLRANRAYFRLFD